MLSESEDQRPVAIDARKFPNHLHRASERMVQKLQRELPSILSAAPYNAPLFVPFDLTAIFRHAITATNLFFYLHAEDRLQNDPRWNPAYTMAALPIVRTVMDCLFNIVLILEDPIKAGTQYRRGGYNKAFQNLIKQKRRYSGDPRWTRYLKEKEKGLHEGMEQSGMLASSLKASDNWPTLGRYLKQERRKGCMTRIAEFLETFTLGDWSEYSAISHSGFEGLMDIGGYFLKDFMPLDTRKRVTARYPGEWTRHVMLAATLELSILTELQAKFVFPDPSLDADIRYLWDTMKIHISAEELWLGRYSDLIEGSGMTKATLLS